MTDFTKYERHMKEIKPEKYKDMYFDWEAEKWRANETPEPEKEPEPIAVKKKRKKKNNRCPASIRMEILERDGHKCCECGSVEQLHVHHIVERCKGGTNANENLITLCLNCHAEKHKGSMIYVLMTKPTRKEHGIED